MGTGRARPFGYADNVGESSVRSGSKERHVRADVRTSSRAGRAIAAGDFRGEAHLGSRCGRVDSWAKVHAELPHARGNLVAEDHAGGDAVRLLSGDDAQVRATQGRGFDAQEDVARPQDWQWAAKQGEGAWGGKRRCEHGIHATRIGLVDLGRDSVVRRQSGSTQRYRTYVRYDGRVIDEPRYAELHAHSAFTFLEGTDEPADMVARASRLGLDALAILDVDGMYSTVQTAMAARSCGLPIVYGAEITLDPSALRAVIPGAQASGWGLAPGAEEPGIRLPILASSPHGYENLVGMMSERALSQTGERAPRFTLEDVSEAGADLLIMTGGRRGPLMRALYTSGPTWARRVASALAEAVGGADHLLIEWQAAAGDGLDAGDTLAELARGMGVRLLATTGARMSAPSKRALGDILAVTRLRSSLDEAVAHLGAHRPFLRSPTEMARLHAAHTEALVHSCEVAKEIVDFCCQRGILCQGRGSAANSAVCFCLGITAVDAVRHNLLFERFLSDARSGPPDIDIDIEACRREEVIRHIYDLYGRDRAAQVANVITYRPRSAMRDAARALGYPAGSAQAWSRGKGEVPALVGDAARALSRLPRHMGIHSGGMVLTDQPVSRICPVGWAAMEGRTVLQWDKEDCADAGLVKFDLLSLGMLTALRVAFDELQADDIRADGPANPHLRGWAPRSLRGRRDQPLGLHTLPEEDSRVYDLLCAADTVGVFQVESRAQMNTLPRLKPRCFYDIVVEVALVRPGPIQGHAVNPYLRRRAGREPVTYLHPLLEPALRQTLGVPLFQEQLMRIATDAAGLSGVRADQLRRAMGAKRSPERMEALKGELMAGMEERGIDTLTRERIFDQLKAFADFGFPESHSFSFAHIVYASAWLKVHAPEHFYAVILSSQPMGFYSPATLVQDARRHGVTVLGPSVNDSFLDTGVQCAPGVPGEQEYREGRPTHSRRVRSFPWMWTRSWWRASDYRRYEAWAGPPNAS